MLECWKTEPKERPSFIDLKDRLDDLLQDCTKSVSDWRNILQF